MLLQQFGRITYVSVEIVWIAALFNLFLFLWVGLVSADPILCHPTMAVEHNRHLFLYDTSPCGLAGNSLVRTYRPLGGCVAGYRSGSTGGHLGGQARGGCLWLLAPKYRLGCIDRGDCLRDHSNERIHAGSAGRDTASRCPEWFSKYRAHRGGHIASRSPVKLWLPTRHKSKH